jgi:hypothetical protein
VLRFDQPQPYIIFTQRWFSQATAQNKHILTMESPEGEQKDLTELSSTEAALQYPDEKALMRRVDWQYDTLCYDMTRA